MPLKQGPTGGGGARPCCRAFKTGADWGCLAQKAGRTETLVPAGWPRLTSDWFPPAFPTPARVRHANFAEIDVTRCRVTTYVIRSRSPGGFLWFDLHRGWGTTVYHGGADTIEPGHTKCPLLFTSIRLLVALNLHPVCSPPRVLRHRQCPVLS